MLKNYFVSAIRSIGVSKSHSAINILGLTIGIAASFLMALFVHDELTFDTFHSKSDRIYRVWARENYGPDQIFFYTTTPYPMGPTLRENFEEVEHQVRINAISAQVKTNQDNFLEGITIAGEDLLSVFDFELIYGDRNTVLHHQGDVILTRRTAEKYFGKENPINKPLSIQLGETFEEFSVKGVIENIPSNSSLQFDFLISDLNLPKMVSQRALTSAWFSISSETYLLLREGTDVGALEKKFPTLFKTLIGEDYEKSHYEVGLQPITDIHLNTAFPVGIAPVSNPRYSFILSAIAGLILMVACINFVTLSVGRSLKRAKEVGIRKVVGAARRQLMVQFIGEALIITIISLALGLLVAALNLQLFNDLSGKTLILQTDEFVIGVGLALVVVIGLVAGSYPAFVLSAFKPISVLKGKLPAGSGKQTFRKSLVGIQLIMSIFLISSTLVMRQQLNYLQEKNLGFNKEQLAVLQINVPRKGRLPERISAGFEITEKMKNQLLKYPNITAACGSSHDFGNGGWVNIGYTDEKGTYRTFFMNVVDEDYVPTLKMELVMGRNFSKDIPSDRRRAILVNEAFMNEYGWTDVVGKRIPGKEFREHEIIGVVKDFNYASLYSKVDPLILTIDPLIPLSGMENINVDNSPVPKLMARLKAGKTSEALKDLEDVWKSVNNGEQFEFSFVDQTLMRQYRSDQNLGRIMGIATLLAILIGSLGLYGLASLAMQNRTKEISIRKVMGATEQSLLILLSRDYVVLILVCLVLSVPFTWYAMNEWLKSFEFKVSIGAGAFLIAGGISLFIAVATISYQAIRTAWLRPTDTLKEE